MHRNTIRLAIAGIAAFYAVFGGLWAINYFPLAEYYRQSEITDKFMMSSKGIDYMDDPEYKKADEAVEVYVLSHPDIFVTERRISRYLSILLWGTVALGVGGGVLFLTRGKRAG